MSEQESSPPRGRLATQLDEWALVREKVLGKLDIRAARQARELANHIREVILRMANEHSSHRPASMVELRALCAEANLLLADAPNRKHTSSSDERATLPVPVPEARPVSKSRRPPRLPPTLGSGVQSSVRGTDSVKNHALRRR